MADGRPTRLVLVTGTGTEVGKTYVASAWLHEQRAGGVRVAARKPAQSFEPGSGPTDAEVLAEATGEHPHDVCRAHRWYERPMAPFMAADVLGRPPFTLAELVLELRWPAGEGEGVDVGLVEGAGGPLSPLATDGGDTADLAALLAPDLVVLVGDAGLGTINAVRLAARPFERMAPLVVVLNRWNPDDELHRRNRAWLEDQAGMRVVGWGDSAGGGDAELL
jgi:dethiobiotin synthetase